MKISKSDLQNMFSMAQDNFVELAPTETINGQNFTARCWLEAAARILGVTERLEYEVRSIPEPVEE